MKWKRVGERKSESEPGASARNRKRAETIRDCITIGTDRRSNAIHRPAINTEKWVISHLELRAAREAGGRGGGGVAEDFLD